MKTFDTFVVKLDKKLKDTVSTKGGLELYIDPRFNEYDNRITEGPVVCVPFKYKTNVKVGDTLYFHHLVVLNDGQPLMGEDSHYLVKYSPSITINNQAFAYKNKKGEIKLLSGWTLLESVEQEELKLKSDIIELVDQKETLPTKGRVAYTAPWVEDLGIEVGDVVGFKKNRDYRISIDGKEYYRTRAEDLMYVVTE